MIFTSFTAPELRPTPQILQGTTTTMCWTLTTSLAGQAVLVDVQREDEGGLKGAAHPELPDAVEPELFKRPASAESRKRAARSAVGARSSVGPPRKSSRK